MFDDRWHAGQLLGRLVAGRVHDAPVVVLALPRGGVPVGIEVARILEGTLGFDLFLVRKLGVPGHEELAFGALATGGIRVFNQSIIDEMALSEDEIDRVVKREQLELERRDQAYRQGRPQVVLRGRTVILVDDGLATGASMMAAVRAVRLHQPERIVVAVPVASSQAYTDVGAVADEVISVKIPPSFYAVGYWYRNFSQVSDEEVRELLQHFTPAGSAQGNNPQSMI